MASKAAKESGARPTTLSMKLEPFKHSVDVLFPPRSLTSEDLTNFAAFKVWTKALYQNLELQEATTHPFHEFPYSLRKIEIQSVDRFGGDVVRFLKIKATIERDDAPVGKPDPKSPKALPGIIFLRGGSVAMLMIMQPRDAREERYVILTEQPRPAAASLQFMEIPAGMLDNHGDYRNKVVEEILEETGIIIEPSEVVDMTKLALAEAKPAESNLAKAMYPSPGACDEYIALFLWEKELDRQEIADLRGKLTGEKTQGEQITLHVRRYEDLWRDGARDAKTLAAWALYEGLNRSGELQRHRKLMARPNSSVPKQMLKKHHSSMI